MMRTFDLCESNQSVGNRNSTTVPTQALTLMNHDFVHLQSHRLAARVTQENRNLEERIRSIWIATLNRNPTKEEQQSSLNFVHSQQEAFTSEPKKEQTSLSLAEILGKTSLHLDAKQAKKDPRSGRVNHIGDLSSNRSDASQNLPEHQPTLSTDRWNGNPYIWFDGKRRFLDLAGEPITQNECTVLAVVSDEGPAGHREIISNWNSSGNIGTSFFIGLTKERDIRITDAFTDAEKYTIRRPLSFYLWSATRIKFEYDRQAEKSRRETDRSRTDDSTHHGSSDSRGISKASFGRVASAQSLSSTRHWRIPNLNNWKVTWPRSMEFN